MAVENEGLIHLFLLGGFEVRRGEAVVGNADWHRRKAAQLLQRLALERRLLREQAIEFLWPRWDPDLGANNLYRTLYALRRTLDEALGEGAAEAAFTFKAGVLTLGESVWVDVEAFERTVSRTAGRTALQARDAPPEEARRDLERALALYGGDLLPDELYADWTLPWRARLRRHYRRACLSLATLYRRSGEFDRAAELLTPLLASEPADEPVHRELMRIYALAGRRDAALRQYEACVEALEKELGMPPGEQTVALHAAIRSGELAPPPAREPGVAPPTSAPLFGREAELRLIAEHLGYPHCRLLTLTGSGGVGKTRLALHAASNQRPAFEDGVVVVPLASLSGPDLLVPAIADALSLTFPAGRSPETHLLAYLRDKRLLLVLDNFEQLSEAAALLPRLLAEAPGVKVLVTSREQLALQQEWVIEVEALSCPEDAGAPDAETYSAVQLFVHTARQLRPGFALSDHNREAMVRVCQLTGGLPLALELAAGWIRTLPVATLADEIAQNPDVLATTMRDVPARHRSLRAVFEESWQQLTAKEQAVFSRLSVFRGSFSRAAAEEVAGATLTVLAALAAKSKLKRTSGERYELHPLLRQFGREKLDARQEGEQVRDSHTRAYIDLLEAMGARLRGGHDREALARIEAEIDDVRAAWRRAVARRDIAAVGRGAEGLTLFYQIRGRYDEALDALNAAITMVDAAAQETADATTRHREDQRRLVRAKLRARQGSIYFCLHRYREARARLEESLTTFRAAGAEREAGYALNLLGDCATLQGLPGQGKRLYQECLSIHTRSGDLGGIAWARNRLGWVSAQLGEVEEAERYLRQALVQFRELNHERGIVEALSDLGLLAHRHGAYDLAESYYGEALALSREMGYEDGVARLLGELGDVLRDQGRLERARKAVSESLAIYRRLGSLDQIRAHYRLGQLFTLLEDYVVAERHLRNSLALAREAGSPNALAHTTQLLAELALAKGNAREAQHRFAESLAQFESIGDVGDPWGIVASHYGLARAAAALGGLEIAHAHLREAITLAQALPSIPRLLDLLVESAAVLAQAGAQTRALDVVAFTLDHPACRRTTQLRAEALFSEWTRSLASGDIAAIRERALARSLDRVARHILSLGDLSSSRPPDGRSV
jgi:predicted ATPase/DNA-binding SARP family transcriptional activator